MKKGFTLIEILVVLTIFGIIALIGGQILTATIKGKNKAEATAKVKSEGNYVISVMEREIHSAQNIISCSGNNRIDYTDADGKQKTFYWDTGGSLIKSGLISSPQNLTSSIASIITFSLTCSPATNPTQIIIDFTLSKRAPSGVTLRKDEQAEVSFQTRIVLRNQ